MNPTPNRSRRPARTATLALLGAGLIGLTPLAGCSTNSKPEPVTTTVNHDFHDALASASSAIKRGELDQADQHLAAARAAANSDDQRTRATDLQLLSRGARAMMKGDGQLAANYFRSISDINLRQQLTVRTRQAGLELPRPNRSKPSQSSSSPRLAER